MGDDGGFAEVKAERAQTLDFGEHSKCLLLGVASGRENLHAAPRTTMSRVCHSPPVWGFCAAVVDANRLLAFHAFARRGDQGIGNFDDICGRPVILDQKLGLRLIVLAKAADEFDRGCRQRRRYSGRRRRLQRLSRPSSSLRLRPASAEINAYWPGPMS